LRNSKMVENVIVKKKPIWRKEKITHLPHSHSARRKRSSF
jgi:hypothetical protein